MNPLEMHGRWDVEAVLGRGSFGTVVRARDRRSGSVRAIKEFRGVDSGFLRELSFVFELRHPNIVACDSFFLAQGGRYLVYEFLEQGSLRELLRGEGGRRTRVELLELVAQACEGVAHAHAHGIVHRDLKPENLLVTQRGGRTVAKVSDFGVAMIRGSRRSDGLGSPAYMAPEQFYDQCDERVDIYALGVVCFEILCGRRPFLGSVEEIMRGHLHVEVELPSWLGPRWIALLSRALAKEPDERHASVVEFHAALREALEYDSECLRERAWPWLVGAVDGLALAPTTVSLLRDGVLERYDRGGFCVERHSECEQLLSNGHHLLYRQRDRWRLQTPIGRRRLDQVPRAAKLALSATAAVGVCVEGGAWQLYAGRRERLVEAGGGVQGLCFVGPRQRPWISRQHGEGVELGDGAHSVPLPVREVELVGHPTRELLLAWAVDEPERVFVISAAGCVERRIAGRGWIAAGAHFVGVAPGGELLTLEARSGALARTQFGISLARLAACGGELCALDGEGWLHHTSLMGADALPEDRP